MLNLLRRVDSCDQFLQQWNADSISGECSMHFVTWSSILHSAFHSLTQDKVFHLSIMSQYWILSMVNSKGVTIVHTHFTPISLRLMHNLK